MIYKKSGYYVTKLKGEAEAYFKTKTEAKKYQEEHKKFEELKKLEVKEMEGKKQIRKKTGKCKECGCNLGNMSTRPDGSIFIGCTNCAYTLVEVQK